MSRDKTGRSRTKYRRYYSEKHKKDVSSRFSSANEWAGKLVEVQTEDYLIRGRVAMTNPTATVFHLDESENLTEGTRTRGRIVIGNIKSKRIIRDPAIRAIHQARLNSNEQQEQDQADEELKAGSEHDEMNGRVPAVGAQSNGANAEFKKERSELVVPEEERMRNSVLYQNLRGRRFHPDETPAHLKLLRDVEQKPGLSKTSDPKWESSIAQAKTTSQNGATTKVPDFQPNRSFADMCNGIRTLLSGEENERRESDSLFADGVFFVDNHFDLVKAVQILKKERTVAFSIRGDLRKSPGSISLLCFELPDDRTIVIDYISCGNCAGKIRDSLGDFLESKEVLKVCIECGITADILRQNFDINLTNVFDPQAIDVYLASGDDKSKMTSYDFCYPLMVLIGLYVPSYYHSIPDYSLNTGDDYVVWLERPLRKQLLDIAVAEVKVLMPLYRTMNDRIFARAATLVNCRLRQYANKNPGTYVPNMAPTGLKPIDLIDPREAMDNSKRSVCEIAQSQAGVNEVRFTKNIMHQSHHIARQPLSQLARQSRNLATNGSYSGRGNISGKGGLFSI